MVVTRIGRGEGRAGGLEYGGLLGSTHLDKLSGLLFVQRCLSLGSIPALCPLAFCWWRGVGRVKSDSGWWNRGGRREGVGN